MVLTGCAMTESTLIGEFAVDDEVACSSDAGVYYLGKTTFNVKVTAVRGGKSDEDYILSELTTNHIPDRRRGYCLDYLASPTASEKIQVKRDNLLLQSISTESVDQSAYILKNLAAAVFKAIPATRGLRAEGKERTAFVAKYDPFDPVESARINWRLSAFGFCIIVENHTFDATAQSVSSYCDDPLSAVSWGDRSLPEGTVPAQSERTVRGIFYRPRVPYAVYLFVRDDAEKWHADRWRLAGIRAVAMENRSPTLSVGIERSFFAARRAMLVFDDGALGNVCVSKTSELLEISTVPLAIVKGIASLPSQIIQFRIEQSDNRTALVQAEQALINTQREHLALLQKIKAGELPDAPPEQTGPAGSADGSAVGDVVGSIDQLEATALDTFAETSDQLTEISVCPADFGTIPQGSTSVLQAAEAGDNDAAGSVTK